MISRLIVIFALALALAACRRTESPGVVAAEPALSLHAITVASERLALFTEVPATIRPAGRAAIAAKLTGTVATFSFGLGQSVAAGDVLLTLSVPETEARLRQSQAQLAEAARAADRERTLVAKGVNAPDAQRDAEDRLRYAQAAQAEAEALLANATIRAPFAGVVTEKYVLPGDLATPGLPLLVIESTQNLRAEGSLPEHLAAHLHIGDPLGVILDDTTAPVTGQIEELSAAADAVSRSLLVKIALPAGIARSGQFVRLLVPGGEADAVLVPADSVSLFGQIERVYVVEQGRAVLRLVRTGRRSGSRIELLAGVSAGERVVLNPPAALRDGSLITELP